MTINNALAEAIGTLHCPHCHMPLFANALEPDVTDGEFGSLAFRFVAPFIMLVDEALPDGAALIERAEALPLWRPSAVVGNDGVAYGDNRNNDFILLTPQLDPALGVFEARVRAAFHAAARNYGRAVGHLQLRSDLGYQLLRYRPGQHFHEHVDQMPGATVYGQRLVTAIDRKSVV